MGVADTLRLTGSCKIQPNNLKSIGTQTKFQIPKWLSFGISKPSSGPRNFRCSSSSSSRFAVSKKFVSLDKVKELESSVTKNLYNYLDNFMPTQLPPQVVSVAIVLLDEDRQLKQKFEQLVSEEDVEKETKMVFDEIFPQLLDNAHLWMSSRFLVSLNLKEAFLKQMKSEQMTPAKSIVNPDEEKTKMDEPNTILSTEVIVDVCTTAVIDEKLKDIHNREDLKAVLHYLMSMEGVMSATAMCFGVLVFKDKTNALEDYCHATT